MAKTNDLLAFLGAVVEKNTESYKEDFDYDIKTLCEAAKKPKAEERTFYWMSRPHGTWCVLEREVFLRGTTAHNIWTHYETGNERFKAYRVVVTGEQDGKLLGELYPINYAEQLRRVKTGALDVSYVSGVYADGEQFSFPYSEMIQNAQRKLTIEAHGGISAIRYEPENEVELSDRIAQEHSLQSRRSQAPHKRKSPTR